MQGNGKLDKVILEAALQLVQMRITYSDYKSVDKQLVLPTFRECVEAVKDSVKFINYVDGGK